MEPKYKLTEEVVSDRGTLLYRIQALKDFGDVKAGDLGGWVQSEANLSHEGNSWIRDEAIARDNSRVSEDAQVRDRAIIADNARVEGAAKVSDLTIVNGDAIVRGKSVKGLAWVGGEVRMEGEAVASGTDDLRENQVLDGKMRADGKEKGINFDKSDGTILAVSIGDGPTLDRPPIPNLFAAMPQELAGLNNPNLRNDWKKSQGNDGKRSDSPNSPEAGATWSAIVSRSAAVGEPQSPIAKDAAVGNQAKDSFGAFTSRVIETNAREQQGAKER